MQASLQRRIRALETARTVAGMEYIGRYFDELTLEQQKAYCKYRYGCEPEIMIECEQMANPSFSQHFLCDRKPKPPTRAELNQIIEEVQQIVLETSNKSRRR